MGNALLADSINSIVATAGPGAGAEAGAGAGAGSGAGAGTGAGAGAGAGARAGAGLNASLEGAMLTRRCMSIGIVQGQESTHRHKQSMSIHSSTKDKYFPQIQRASFERSSTCQ